MLFSRFGALLLLAAAAGCDGQTPRGEASVIRPKLAIVASGDTAGWLTPCGCTSNQSGGLLRRGAYIDELRKSAEVLVVDVGGAPASSAPYDKQKFEAILQGELAMGLTAHNLGASEIALGPDYLRQIRNKLSAPLISANVSDASGEPITSPSISLTLAGRSILIIGVVSPKLTTDEVKISDPRQAVLAILDKLPKKPESLIVLAYFPEDELREFATQLPEADIVLGGPTGQCLAPSKIGPVHFASATNKGKFLITFEADANGKSPLYAGSVSELTSQYSDAPAQSKNLAAFRDRLSQLDLTAEVSGLGPLSAVSLPRQFEVAGSHSCKECHAAEYQQWSATSHSHALRTLEQNHAHMDSFCQRCHVNAFGRAGGFVSARRSADQGGVGCESCHGPSKPHVAEPTIKTPFAAKQQCVLCHDHENSPEFDYEKYWAQIVHGAKPPKPPEDSPSDAPSQKEAP